MIIGIAVISAGQTSTSAAEKGIQLAIDKEFEMLQSNNLINDDKKIERLANLYFMAVNQGTQNDNISLSSFYYPDNKYADKQNYLNKKMEYNKKTS